MFLLIDQSRVDSSEIKQFADSAAALAYASTIYAPDFRVIGFVEAPMSDTWQKWSREPSAEDIERLTAEVGDVTVREPGTHPGGRAWWVEPVATVHTTIIEEING